MIVYSSTQLWIMNRFAVKTCKAQNLKTLNLSMLCIRRKIFQHWQFTELVSFTSSPFYWRPHSHSWGFFLTAAAYALKKLVLFWYLFFLRVSVADAPGAACLVVFSTGTGAEVEKAMEAAEGPAPGKIQTCHHHVAAASKHLQVMFWNGL